VVIDKLLAAAGLVCSSPMVALAGLAIRLSSPGPVFFRARRAGVGGRPFTMLKLRTMHVGAESGGRITATSDARVFPVGAALRRLKLDEAPQLLNVLRGEMALVGPRPEDVAIVEERYDSLMWETLEVPPGMTSPGSLHYFTFEDMLPADPAEAERLYLEDLLPRKIALDLVYVRHRSVSYQLEILLRTALRVVGLGRLFQRRMAWERREADRILQESGA
jgi:lipopolysaccharide/colanic/teichoic acid biosynthesis glycosyltransferase